MFRVLTMLAATGLLTAEACNAQPFCELGRPLYQFFSTRDYGGDNQNWSTIQDPEGLLFFGNNNFVLDYDGQRWDHIAVPGGFAIRGLAVDSTGEIWVGGAGKLGHLVRDGGHYQFVPIKADPRLPSGLGEVLDIVPCGSAEFVRTEKMLLVYQNGTWDAISWPRGNGFDYIVAATANRVFVHGKDEPLYEVIDKRLVPVVDDSRLRTTVVYRVIEPVPGMILLLTKEHGIFRLKQNGIEPFRTEIDPLLARYAIQWASCPSGTIHRGSDRPARGCLARLPRKALQRLVSGQRVARPKYSQSWIRPVRRSVDLW